MTWRDRLLPASYRGATFRVESHSATPAGRRVQVHEYPGRDTPYVEDLGQRTPEYEIQGYLVGDEYARERDALVATCTRRGPGTLVHPYLGTLEVVCTECNVSERTQEGRMARVRLTFRHAGRNRYPAMSADTAAAVNAAADVADAAAQRQLEAAWQ